MLFLSLNHNLITDMFSTLKTFLGAAAAAKLLQSCLTLSDPMDCSLPGSSVHGIFQARILEWVAIAFSEKLSLVPITIEEGAH